MKSKRQTGAEVSLFTPARLSSSSLKKKGLVLDVAAMNEMTSARGHSETGKDDRILH